jgi:hypothetical protein
MGMGILSSNLLTYECYYYYYYFSLVEDVLGEGSGDKVPVEKVVMLIWQFRDDPSVVTFMARFMAKVRLLLHKKGREEKSLIKVYLLVLVFDL